MSDTAAKTLRKAPELPKNRGKASEVLAAEPKTSLRQLAADNTDKKTLKNISGILDKFVSYSKTPADRTTDITIRTVQEETAEALETTSLIISLSTKHLEEQNKTLEDILKLLRIRSKKESDATGGGSILGSLLDLLDYDGGKKAQKQRRYSSEREKKARQRLRQMRRQRMIRKLTRSFQRPTAPTITPPATSVTKPPVTPARPTVPEVTKPPVTPEPEAKKTYKTEFDKNGKTRYRDIETGRFIKDPTKNNLAPASTTPEVSAPKPVTVAPEVSAPKPASTTPEVSAPKPVTVAPEVSAPKPVTVAPEVSAPKPVAPEVPKPVTPEVTKIEQPKVPGKDATKVTGQAAKKLSGLKLGGAVLTVIEGLSLMSDLDQIEHEYTIGEINKEQYKQRYGSTIGSFLGGTAGGAVLGSIGAVLGAPLLGVGSVVFGVLGGVAGTFAGSAIGSWIGETVAAELVGDTPPKPPSPRAMTTKDQKDIRSMLQDKEFVSSLDPKVVQVLEIISDEEQVDLRSAVKARGAKNILEGLIQENKEAFTKAYKKKETTQDKPDATPTPVAQVPQVSETPATPVAQVPATPATSQVKAALVAPATPVAQVQSESIDRNKLIDRLKTVSSKITDKDEKTVNRLENITRMIQNNELNEASAAIERMEKQFSSTQEKPLSEAFRERQNRPQTAPDAQRQRQSSATDGSYQVASAQTTMTDAMPVASEETESKPTTKKADDADNTKISKTISTDIFGTSTDIKQETTATSDAKPIISEPVVKLASDVSAAGEKIVDPTKTTTKVINETVNDINGGQITKATNTVEKLTSEVKEQNKFYETLNSAMSLLGFKRDIAKQTEQSKDIEQEKAETPTATPQAQATQNVQQLQAQVTQAPVSSKFSSGFSRMAGLAAGFMGASAAATTVGRPSRDGTGGANRIAAGALGTVGGAAVMGAMMQPQNLGAFGSILSGGAAGAGAGQAITPQGRPSIAGTDGAAANITGDDASVMAMIKEHEGYKTKPYKDSRGFWTVGVGHLIGANLPPEMNREFTMQEIDQLFAKDYAEHKQAAMRIPGFEKLNPSGQAAVIDLTFNMGPAWYKKFPNASAALAKGDMETFANEMQNSAWFKQVGRRGPKIVAMLRGGGGQGGTMQASQQTAPGAQIASASTSMEAADQAQMRSSGQALQGTTAPVPSTGPQGIQMPMAAAGMGEIPINIRLRQLQS